MDESPELQQFHDKFIELQSKIVDAGVENSVAWFKKKSASREVIEAIFNPILKVSRDKDTGEPDGKWPPTMKLKVSRKNGFWEAGRDRSGREKPLVVKNCDNVTYNIVIFDYVSKNVTESSLDSQSIKLGIALAAHVTLNKINIYINLMLKIFIF